MSNRGTKALRESEDRNRRRRDAGTKCEHVWKKRGEYGFNGWNYICQMCGKKAKYPT